MNFDSIIDKINENIQRSENEYLGEDGLLHCAVCKQKTQTEIKSPFTGAKRIVTCACDCRRKEIEARKERERQEELERQKRICFSETNMATWTFERDDRKNAKLSDAMQNYVKNFADFKKDGKGLLLYGTPGTGKTYYAACIANGLIDNGYSVLMTNFARLTNKIQGMFEGKQEFIDSLNRYSLLVIDDLGAERSSEYMIEQVFNIVDSRYRAGLPMIITTNLTATELKGAKEISYARIYDRILERCFPLEISGTSRRRQNVRETFIDVKEKLGL